MEKIRKRNRLLIRKYTIMILKIIIGTIFMAIGISQFLLPNQLSSGGFSGIATIIFYFFKVPVGITIVFLNLPFFVWSFFKMGNKFFLRAAFGTLMLSTFVDLFSKLPILTNDRFLACVFGGIVIGIGTALILKVNSSTGGSDLLSYIFNYYKPSIRPGSVIIAIDVIVVSLNMIFFKQIEIGLYSAITIYIMGKMIDIVFEGINFTKTLFVISEKYEEIAKQISGKIGRGSTGIYSKGMYTNKNKMTLFCVGSRNEVQKIIQICYEVDPKSFIVIGNAREVYGKGFKRHS